MASLSDSEYCVEMSILVCVFKDLQGISTGTHTQKRHSTYAHCMALNTAGLSSAWLSWFSLSLAVHELVCLLLTDTGMIHFSIFATCMFHYFLLISPFLSLSPLLHYWGLRQASR